MNLITRLTSLALCVTMLFGAVSCATAPSNPAVIEQEAAQEQINYGENMEELAGTDSSAQPTGNFNEGVVLVKYTEEMTSEILKQLDFKSAEPLYPGSEWYYVEQRDSANTVETVSYLREISGLHK